jgi:hypothetical protein
VNALDKCPKQMAQPFNFAPRLTTFCFRASWNCAQSLDRLSARQKPSNGSSYSAPTSFMSDVRQPIITARDVIKNSIEKIGGAVEVPSVPGLGTTVRMKIPLTLAIIPRL